jgi:glycosyltransferase involved in cell wall biosynthesis
MSKDSKIKPQISVVIGTYNQGHLLRKVLGGYTQQTLPSDQFEIIIADSSSKDKTADIVAEFSMLPIQYHCVENQGKAYARNFAAQQASGAYLLITDADMIPDEDFIQAHIKAHEATQNPTCFEGAAFNLKTLEWPLNFTGMTPQIGKILKKNKHLGWYCFLTANVSIPRHLFHHVNGFSTDFTDYGWEDLELGYRLHKLNIPLLYLPTSINYHYHIYEKDEKLKTMEKAGKSAKIFIKLHPELKYFIGIAAITTSPSPLNLIAVFLFKQMLFKQIKKRRKLYTYIEEKLYKSKNQFKHKLGFQILQRFFYLKGLLD